MTPTTIDRIVDAVLPDACSGCGGRVVEDGVADQYQTDIVQVATETTHIRVHQGVCDGCGRRVQGRHALSTSDALGAAAAQVGPKAKALAASLHYEHGLSFGRCADILSTLGVDVTRGALAGSAASIAQDLGPTFESIVAELVSRPVVVMDETGWKLCGDRAWLWAATTGTETVYLVRAGRGFEDATALIPADYRGVIVSDGWVVYRRYDEADRQSCLAHLTRRCSEMITDLPRWARGTPREVKALLQEALAARELDGPDRVRVAADLDERIELLGERPHPHPDNARLVKHLTNERADLFTFLTVDGVDATNWRAEQAMRPAVVNRKTWGGNRTRAGADRQGILMTILRTARQRGVDIIETLVELAHSPTPTIMPLPLPTLTPA